ncbi:MAG: hypothetical protein Q7S00_04325, partial [bacterium]|nr:hypothetical protein [bacterium]
LYLLVLLGLGLTELSMNPLSIPRVKNILRQVTFKQASQLLEKVLNCVTASDVKKIVSREMAKIKGSQGIYALESGLDKAESLW